MRVDLQVLRLAFGLFVALTVTSFICLAQNDHPQDGRYYESMALKAYQQKDYASFLENMKKAIELRPNHPRLMYNLAVAFALNSRPADAVQWLRKTAEMGLVFAAASDRDFDSIKTTSEFQAVLKQFEKNKSPKVSSLHAFTVHEKGLVPESVAYDSLEQVFYLGSVYKRKILRITKHGEVTVFAGESDDLWSVMGMKVDKARRLLWVCTAAHNQMAHYKKEDEGKSALFKYDLQSGKLIATYQPADKSKPHWLGDLVLNSQGDVFATDSVTPAVYVLRRDQQQLETFLEGPPFVSPQGLDFTRDQKHLFVADYSKGIFVVDTQTKKVTNIAANFTLLGIDGLYFHKGTLLCVQNGVNPNRLIRLFPNKDLSRFERFQTLEANNPVFDEPTLGVLVKDDFYFVANSQWGAIDPTGHLASEDKLRDPTVLRVRL
jgi:sugar lactone lactonase YvrE